ncbi:hypothetical protein [Rathayibacter sp. VKM Ac-2857]|uniref:hypothetical protein n=1 Tax=Rathayibacter sp. VKM Ac-2857 TaxID=2739020 RepID=UPI001565FE76|nr:hypothetical protein [Rathayibacter sp. VKM Ac-2857]NQX17316.1 hypothetical protein [Rathayibacter sp. VKM Ac-2857]
MAVEWESIDIERSVDGRSDDEPLGTKEKFWLVSDGELWLFKFARDSGGVTRGEDWAEWVSFHLGRELSIPCAEVRPARVAGRRGIMSRSVVETDLSQRLEHGNSLLRESDRHYVSSGTRENERYTVEAVRRALDGVAAPPGFTGPAALSGFDVWAGYLLFDAWIAGQDRHHVISGRPHRRLSPSYDHGNSLGFQESEVKRLSCLAERAVFETWLRRGRSPHFAGRPRLTDLARQGLASASPSAREFWVERLASVRADHVSAVIAAVPPALMSVTCASFTEELLVTNRRRLLDDLAH